MNYTERSLKVTVVGDGTVGKTCLLHVFQKKKFPTDYVPTVMDEYPANVVIGHKCYSITLWDTAGQEDYDRLRPLAYPNTDVFIMCYAVDNKTTFENIFVKWIIEIKSYCPNAAILIVGTKLDKRGDSCNGKTCECATDNKHVLLHEAQMMAKKNKCSQVIECSALTGENVQEVFQEAVKAALKINTQNSKFCCLLS